MITVGTTMVGTARAGIGAVCTYSPGLVGAAAMAGIIGVVGVAAGAGGTRRRRAGRWRSWRWRWRSWRWRSWRWRTWRWRTSLVTFFNYNVCFSNRPLRIKRDVRLIVCGRRRP